MNRTKGFTLIKLLVVIAVIAVLMAILMPALNIAREQARGIACSSNQKTIALAYIMYASDNDGTFSFMDGHSERKKWDDNRAVIYCMSRGEAAAKGFGKGSQFNLLTLSGSIHTPWRL